MKTYEGARSLDGALVTVDGRPLPPRLDLRTLSKAGFEWTYEGAGPAQLGVLSAARRRGLTVVAADRDPSAPGFRYADRRAIVSIEDELGRASCRERV